MTILREREVWEEGLVDEVREGADEMEGGGLSEPNDECINKDGGGGIGGVDGIIEADTEYIDRAPLLLSLHKQCLI